MAEPRWLSEREARAWRGYRRMRALLDLRLAQELAGETGLSEADYDVLSNLSEAENRSCRLGELAARMLWTTSRLSHQISRMRERGLVERRECAGDARGSLVVLTAAGVRAIEQAAPGHVASVRRHFVDLLTGDQLDALAAAADTVIEHLTAEPGR